MRIRIRRLCRRLLRRLLIRVFYRHAVKYYLLFIIGVWAFTISQLITYLDPENEMRMLQLHEKRRVKTEDVSKAVQMPTSVLLLPGNKTTLREPGPEHSCETDGGGNQFLFMMVVSSPESFSRRRVLRQVFREGLPHWRPLVTSLDKSYSEKDNIKYGFFIGRSRNCTLNEEIEEESSVHGDIIIEDFRETFLNLTLKTLRILKWVGRVCPKVSYLLKVDEDVFVNIPHLISFLFSYEVTKNYKTGPVRSSNPNLIAGNAHSDLFMDEDLDSKWFTPKSIWPSGKFPPFVSGFFYILGSSARVKLYEGAVQTPFFHLEDVFLTGIVRRFQTQLEITHIEDIVASLEKVTGSSSTCRLTRFVAIHSVTEESLSCWHQIILQPEEECSSILLLFFECYRIQIVNTIRDWLR